MTDWKPGASLEALRLRAALLAKTRAFFAARNVLEVETPLLTNHTVTDVHLESLNVIRADASPGSQAPLFLQTSPEFAMKRILAAGSGAIYQLCKAFRAGETSARHNPEFTMLEWYRPGYSLEELMDEVGALLQHCLGVHDITRLSYRDAFKTALGIDPHTATHAELGKLANAHVDLQAQALDSTDYLQLLMSEVVEPALPANCFVYDYPQAQAALAVVAEDAKGQLVARRFELYGAGMELANGYQECLDAGELRRRFRRDQQRRQELGLTPVDMDEKLLAALPSMTACSGVALGFDRLLMLASKSTSIEQVISFTTAKT
ncbi:MAG: EF-P lysine aminoacylase EpmA [Gammaproteobacteria bacterium]